MSKERWQEFKMSVSSKEDENQRHVITDVKNQYQLNYENFQNVSNGAVMTIISIGLKI